MYEGNIDWSIFKPGDEATCYCRCGGVFRSYAKGIYKEGCGTVTKEPCPKCGRNDDCIRVSWDEVTFIRII